MIHEVIEMIVSPKARSVKLRAHVLMAGTAFALLAGCDKPLDIDIRGAFGGAFNTADAARAVTAPRPKPDNRGIISYPTYQVAVARRGDTLQTLADRIGADAKQLAKYNGINPEDTLRKGEVIALRARVSEPSPETGAATTGPILPAEPVNISELAGSAIDNAGDQKVETTTLPAAKSAKTPKAQTGREPLRHTVSRGETAFTISRLYNVSVRSLAEWNGLGSDFAIREGQKLMIPVAIEPAATPSKKTAEVATTAPGSGTPTPTPPSSTKALPKETTVAAAKTTPKPATPDLSTKSTNSNARMGYPVTGNIIREYTSGKNDGIDIAATAGTPVLAAKSGTVAAVTADTDDIQFLLVKHAGNLVTVYYNVDKIGVAKGDKVKRGQALARVKAASPSFLHFEVRKGFESVDPLPYLQ